MSEPVRITLLVVILAWYGWLTAGCLRIVYETIRERW